MDGQRYLERFERTLRRAAADPAYRRRASEELRGHLEELAAHAAGEDIVQRLGAPEAVARQLLTARRHATWLGRRPWLVVLAAPGLILAGYGAAVAGAVLAAAPQLTPDCGRWAAPMTAVVAALALWGCADLLRRRLARIERGWTWPWLGAVLAGLAATSATHGWRFGDRPGDSSFQIGIRLAADLPETFPTAAFLQGALALLAAAPRPRRTADAA